MQTEKEKSVHALGINMTETKTCKKCGEEKELSEFYYAQTAKDRLQQHCKACHKKGCAEYLRKRYNTDTEFRIKTRAYHKAYDYLHRYSEETCNIIRHHHEEMKDDPERLSTEFIQTIVGRKC